MIPDKSHSADYCIGPINRFWRKLGSNVQAHVNRQGEISSLLTDGEPGVKLSQASIVAAYKASGAFKTR